jgi:enterochelin esterase-like enzyme
VRAALLLAAALLSGCASSGRAAPARPQPDPCRTAAFTRVADASSPELAAFERFLREYRAAAPALRGEFATRFVAHQRAGSGFPIVAADGTAIFFFHGAGAEREVRLVGDFKTRGFHDISWDRDGEPMERPAADGAVFFARLRFEPDARFDYQFVVDGQPRPDPLNPRAIPSGAALSLEASQVVMPGYALPDQAQAPLSRGTLHTMEEPWAAPRVTIYLPPGYDPATTYPTLYTADGSAWLEYIGLPAILDHLIATGRIAPAIAVMIDAAEDRSVWYGYNPAYLAYLERVVDHVDSHHATRKEAAARVHIGTSAGGRAALFAALERPRLFGKVALLSPSLGNAVYYFAPYLSGDAQPPPGLRVWLGAGTHEGSICEDARIIEQIFLDAGLTIRARYTHEGHSFGTWRRAAIEALEFLLPR